MIYHNSQNTIWRNPFGAALVGSQVALRLDISELSEPVKVFLSTTHNGVSNEIQMTGSPLEYGGFSFTADLTLPEDAGLLFYYFRIEFDDLVFYYGNNPERLGGEGYTYECDPVPYQITVYRNDSSPSWYKEGIVYQIFPDRFARSEDWRRHQMQAEEVYYDGYLDLADRPSRKVSKNWEDVPIYPRNKNGDVSQWVFSGGDLDGIRSKLDYLAELGVTILYLNPIFRAASNHKYDTADYLRIDEAFGDEKAFSALCDAAREKGIRIILDGVFNHTGADSKYFNLFARSGWLGAYQGEDSPYYSWFRFTEDGYESWWGVRDLPDVNELTDSYMDYIYRGASSDFPGISASDSVISHWMRLGASGWRLDVADELPDEFIRGIRAAMMKENPDSILLGEVWEDASNKTSYGVLREYFLGDELQAVMNYPFRTASLDFLKGNISAGTFAAILMSLKENYPRENFYSDLNLIGSHDRARVLNELSDTREILEARIADPDTVLSPEEKRFSRKGVSRADAIKAAFKIPEDKLHLAKKRLKIISLLQFVMPGVPCIYYGDEAGMTGWDDPFNRGTFPWGQEDMDLTEHYRSLCKLRQSHKVLIDGDFMPYSCSDHVICFERFNENERFRLFANRGIFEWEDVTVEGNTFTLPPLGWKILCG